MRALRVVELKSAGGLRIDDVPRPSTRGGDLLVDVYAVGVSYPDLLRSRGEYQEKNEVPYTLGQECSGIVAEASSGSGFTVGDRVAGFTRAGAGAAAEQALVDPAQAVPLPDGTSFEEGAALPLNYGTAVVALAIRGRMRPGETLLIHGAAGGTGSAAIQVGRGLGGRVIAVVSTDEKARIASDAGADVVLRADGPWKDETLRETGGRGADLVFDPVCGERVLDTMRALAVGGRWIVIGFVGGAIPQVALNRVLLKNIDIVGSYYHGYISSGPSLPREVTARLVDIMRSGRIRPVVGPVHELARGEDALRDLAERRAIGKVVLKVR